MAFREEETMNCPLETRGNTEPLVAYSAQRLDAAEAAPLEKHLAECARCSEFVHGQQAVWQVLDTWEAEPVSADFDRRLYRRIRQNLSWWDRVLQSMQPLLVHRGVPVVATAALVVVAGVLLDRTTAPDPTPVRTAAVQLPTWSSRSDMSAATSLREL